MKEHIYIDGDRVNSLLPLRSLFYGEGVFESFRYRGKMPLLIDEHFHRMKKGADLLKIPCPSDEYLFDLLNKVVLDSEIDDAYVKICLLAEGDSAFYRNADSSQVLVIIKEYVSAAGKSIKLTVNSFATQSGGPLKAIKSMNYLENVIARREALDLGFDEALFLNEREEIVECSASNIFWFKEGKFYTPKDECGCLPGTTRNLIVDLIGRINMRIESGRYLLADLLDSEFAFVTNSLIGCIPVSEIDGSSFNINHDLLSMVDDVLFERLGWI